MRNIKPVLIPTILELLLLGAKNGPVKISTAELAQRVGRSQQSASKHLQELEKERLIERVPLGQRLGVKLTVEGLEAVTGLYLGLKKALEEVPTSMEIRGRLFTGIGEGAYYVSLKGYRRQFISKLGFDPYPGTLNLRLASPSDRRLRRELEHYGGIRIEGFEDENRTYGSLRCFYAVVNGKIEGATLAIERTHYDESVLEVIAPVQIREKLGLKDGEEVRVRVLLEPEGFTRARSPQRHPGF